MKVIRVSPLCYYHESGNLIRSFAVFIDDKFHTELLTPSEVENFLRGAGIPEETIKEWIDNYEKGAIKE